MVPHQPEHYAEDYALVERLAGLGLDELLANATSA